MSDEEIRPLPGLIAAQVRRTPDALAVLGPGGRRSYTYRELERRAGQVAAFLRGRGIRPGAHVAVRMERSPELIAALLGVWKAGAAYVPIDPAGPAERSARILADGAAAVELTPELFAEIPDDPAEPAFPALDGGDEAYVMYTSGSTGTPKGVVITHAGIANRVLWTVRRHGLGPADRVLQKTTIGFDAAGWEIWAPLVSGGVVVLAPPGAERDPAVMLRAVAEHGVTVLQVVPSVLRLLVEEDWTGCDALRLLFSAGEALHAELCHKVLAKVDVELWNTYGPTECSIDVTAHRFDPAQTTGPVPIGRPLPGLRVVVLDERGRPVPIGVPGELYAGGVGVALGYQGRPALTAERFVPDPFGPAGSLLYRTGDQVRWRGDRTLEYLGRLDSQLKVNGVRVEPGEVEAALSAHPSVRAAAVVAVDGRLVAYVAGAAPSREFLFERLPAALVPAVFVELAELPLTANGKVDRAALPTPDLSRPAYTAPRTIAEKEVAGAWAELLDLPQVGVHDDFFHLGGSSLLLTRLAGRLGDVPLPALFTATTVEAQARLLEDAADVPPVTRVSRSAPLPLSVAQHQFWLLDRMNPGGSEWNAPLFVRLPAALTPQDVDAVLTALVERHEILRTRYVADDGEPRQVIDPPAPVGARVVDGPVDLDDELGRGFDLAEGPVWRAVLFRNPGEDHLLALVIHHIACDGWSSAVLARDIRDLAEGRRPAPPPIQYADYGAWHRTHGVDESQLAYWRERLAGLKPLELPTDRPRPARRDALGSAVTFAVPAELMAALEAVGRRRQATPYTVLLTALASLLGRYGAGWDVPIGTSVTGRTRPEFHDVVGVFLNTVVMRCALEADLTFAEAVSRMRDVTQGAFAHQALPFDWLIDELQPERDPSRTPLYQVMFNFHEAGLTGVANAAADLEAASRAWRVARTDLTLVLERQDDGSAFGFLEYATALFDRGTVERMGRHLLGLLRAVAADPAVRLAELDVLTDEERARLARPAERRPVTCVHGDIAGWAERDPDRIALVGGGTSLTYGELDRRAVRLAHRLRGLGVGPETVVGVSLPRGAGFVVAVLGVWKAGGAYVPVSPADAPERRSHILEVTAARVVIDEDFLAEAESGTTPPETGPGAGVPLSVPNPGAPAYVMFTSGSTGRPKGVQVEHRSLATMLAAARDNLDFGEHSAWLAMAEFTFDISCVELFLPLSSGGRTVIADAEQVLDHAAQLRLMDEHAVTHLQVSPPHWQMLIDAGFGVRDVTAITGGEATTPAHLSEIASRVRVFFNEYGLTETTVAATRWRVPANAETACIGHPYPHVSVYLLDEEMRPVPPGAIGELYIGGAGVARGYMGRPGLTASRFLPDPFTGGGNRLYRTGDLCRELPDGALVFAGRADRQVKVRGRRVELGEIEAVLTEYPGVRAAVVALRDDQVVAYCVGEVPAPAELIAHAGRFLPDYMVPGRVVPIDRIPLNRNSKIDYEALFRLEQPPQEKPDMTGAPRNRVEYRIAGLWADVLDRFVGVEDDFFQAGGTSMLATRLVSDVRREFGAKISMRAFFDNPTIAGMAVLVEEAVRASVEEELAAQEGSPA
ncbi:non-ribosomal peptide synthetase [Actinoallomurus soli]|uniref:non-ribosomal peptide synthetase n=1 Tax=Actinoallomurus soli TaxID=2952535 RepID=UPI0020934916|nr:non-ribosomal peptide synthetase [Actinoallomurus soli]MCO5968360.1 amino acid adenylation domain-containing protein [Actinoallomurus soli]